MIPPAELSQLLAAVAEKASLPIWVIDADGKLGWSNASYARFLPASFAEDAPWKPLYDRARASGQPVLSDESFDVGGQPRDFAVSVYPVGERVAVVCRETTAQMKLYSGNDRLQREADERAASERVRATIQQQMLLADRLTSVGTLASGVAHEINNPLAAVLVNLQLAIEDVAELAKRNVAPELVGHLEEELQDAAAACDRVKNIIRDLKVFARNSERDATGPVNVQQVLELSLRMATSEIVQRAKVVKNIETVAAVNGNEARLGQVFLNLLMNAAQAIPEGRPDLHEIRVTARNVSEGRVEVEISDTGVGIPPENLPRIFDPFFSTKPTGEGMGLGLSIAHQIVTSMGGTLTARSEHGRGATFTVTLPTSPSVMLVTAPLGGDELPLRRGRLLSVDDEPMVGTFVRRMLASQHDVDVVTSGQAALERIKAGERYDLILCDVMMPQMSGLDLYWELHRIDPSLAKRMVFLTAASFTPSSRAFFELTANPRIEKPFDARELRLLVNRCINRGEAL
jgi:signal transduction histidine kinase